MIDHILLEDYGALLLEDGGLTLLEGEGVTASVTVSAYITETTVTEPVVADVTITAYETDIAGNTDAVTATVEVTAIITDLEGYIDNKIAEVVIVAAETDQHSNDEDRVADVAVSAVEADVQVYIENLIALAAVDSYETDVLTWIEQRVATVTVTNPYWAIHLAPLSLSLPSETERRISWTGNDDEYLFIIDGSVYATVEGLEIDLDESIEVREYLWAGVACVAGEPDDWLPTPMDKVDLDWSGDADIEHHVWRRKDGGTWAEVVASELGSYTDGPLLDGVYDYKIVAEDDEGNEATSSTQSVTVDSVPEPPTGLAWSFVDATKTLTLTWTASTSADVATYPVRSSAGEPELDVDGAPVQDDATTTYSQVFTTETGIYVFAVHAKDTDGNEEQNITEAVIVPMANGLTIALPDEPRIVIADPSAGGKVTVSWLYRPDEEYNGPGAAFEARIYYDNATGTIDYTTPLATVAMSNPTSTLRYSWTSGVLTNDVEYLFDVRIATAAHPAGIETDNEVKHGATPSNVSPTTPTLTADLA